MQKQTTITLGEAQAQALDPRLVEQAKGVLLSSLADSGGKSTVWVILGAAVTIGIIEDAEGRAALDSLEAEGRITRTGEGNAAEIEIVVRPMVHIKRRITETLEAAQDYRAHGMEDEARLADALADMLASRL